MGQSSALKEITFGQESGRTFACMRALGLVAGTTRN